MALTPEWWAHHRERQSRWHSGDLQQIREDVATMQREIDELEAKLASEHDTTPTQITLTVS